ncbi:restriction endonuclease subunit M [Bacteroidia bacterium]|nr:restriction endonuclease subunit M [Bacteroidia bacterium]GHV41162.1 restriction endonuclease subunit M [Bacteroidia bacterium]
MEQSTNNTIEEVVLEDNQLICVLTNEVKPAKVKELTLQSLISMLNEEYGFDLSDMERDFTISYINDEGKNKRIKVDLAMFEAGKVHNLDHLIRICIVQDDKVKVTDDKKGVVAALEATLSAVEKCEFGVWTNGEVFHFLQKHVDDFYNTTYLDIADFPGEGQTMEDLEKWSDKIAPRKPANDSLVRTFKRCHDYIYGNEGQIKDAFWELLNLIFCKIYDEKRKFMPSKDGMSYRRKFWVGVKEQNSKEGLEAIAKRIKGIFDELMGDDLFKEVFEGNERIGLSDKGLAYVASELAKYSFLDATVDVKGTAYETIVSNTLKQAQGQFFTPRNIIKCMVEMLDPEENMRVLDPACGSGGFLVMVLDHVRKKIAARENPNLKGLYLEETYNSKEINDLVKDYAERMIFGFDFDRDLKKAARMNMVMAGDGHANIFNINSLDYPNGPKTEELEKIKETIQRSIQTSYDRNDPFETDDAREKFDLIFTNPPFGAKVTVDKEISKRYALGHNWSKDTYGNFQKGNESSSEAPEVLFIEQCYNFLKPGGRMAIVLPDGILGNPNTEYVRAWILERFKLLASIDLPVEAFLPQVGVQASLLFLQKKTSRERDAAQTSEDYEVFMAIAEAVGKDRRGVPIYLRDEDGAELLFDGEKKTLIRDNEGKSKVRTRQTLEKRLNDDLPLIKDAYLKFVKEQKK